MGHLYYTELGNPPLVGIYDFKKGPFKNLIPFQYYTGDRVGFNNSDVYFFNFAFGEMQYGFEATNMYALAVHSDNIGASVPIPGTLWLLTTGLVGLIGFKRCYT